jgi:hypothetical protein
MSQTCAQHPEVPALYVCDGCQKPLCGDCIEESHALLLCRLCGERAMPLHAEQPATVRDLQRRRKVTGPYTLADALAYPFRGSGLVLYVATLLVSGVLWALGFLGGCGALILQAILWGLIVGLQFKIVRSTAEGENELPDWPDFTEVGALLLDFFTWLGIHVFIGVSVAVFFGLSVFRLLGSGSAIEPRLDFWIAFALCLWLGAAFMVMAFGAAGNYRRLKIFEIHNHVRGYLAAGADAVKITNLLFALGAVTFLMQSFLEGNVPYVGPALSSVIGVYWIFMVPHLAGLLFRRHSDTMEKLYWPAGGLGY